MVNRLLTATEVAKLLGISRVQFYRLKDKPPHIMIGTVKRYREDSFDAWLAERESK